MMHATRKGLAKVAIALAVLLPSSLLTTACADSTATTAGAATTLTIANNAGPMGFDIADQSPGFYEQYVQPLYDSLFRISPTGDVTPNIATKWEYDTSLTTLTIHIRTDVKFTDGEPLDAAAVKASLDHTRSGSSIVASLIKGISSVDVVDPATVAVRLSAPDPSLLANLGMTPGMLASPKAIAAGTLKTSPVGSGPYVIDSASTTAGSQYTYVRNTGYWNAQAFPFDKFVIKVLTEPSAVLNALLSGQIDAGPMSTVKDATTAANGGMKIAKWRNGDMEALWLFDKQGKTVPALADVRVRQAINYALDRTSIVKAGYGDLATPTDQLFAIDTDNGIYDPALEARYAYDPSKAKKLLAEAGYSNGLDITMPDTSTWAPEVVAAIVQNLKDVGIRVTLDPAPADQIYSMVLEGRWAIHWQPYDTNRPWDTTQYQLKKDAPWNMTHYEDPKVTELIGKIQRATGDDQIALFRELNTYLVDIAWAAPINATVMEYAYSPRVEVTPQAFSKRPPLYDYKPAAG